MMIEQCKPMSPAAHSVKVLHKVLHIWNDIATCRSSTARLYYIYHARYSLKEEDKVQLEPKHTNL